MPGSKLPFSDVPPGARVPGAALPKPGGPHIDPPGSLAPPRIAPPPMPRDEGPGLLRQIGGTPTFSRGHQEHVIRHRRGRKGFKPPGYSAQ